MVLYYDIQGLAHVQRRVTSYCEDGKKIGELQISRMLTLYFDVIG